MFNLTDASEGIRKAVALQGVRSGRVEFVFDQKNQTDSAIIAKVYNRNYPVGIEVMKGDADNALNYTWREINEHRSIH